MRFETVADNGEGLCLGCGERIRLNQTIVRDSKFVYFSRHRECEADHEYKIQDAVGAMSRAVILDVLDMKGPCAGEELDEFMDAIDCRWRPIEPDFYGFNNPGRALKDLAAAGYIKHTGAPDIAEDGWLGVVCTITAKGRRFLDAVTATQPRYKKVQDVIYAKI